MTIFSGLQCKKCNKILTKTEMPGSIEKYGLVYLWSEKHVFLGCNCTHCPTPTPILQFFERESVDSFVKKLFNDIKRYYGPLAYHSFPNRLRNQAFGDERNYIFTTVRVPGDVATISQNAIDMKFQYPIEDHRKPNDFCSYLIGIHAIGPEASIWWLKQEHIEKLAQEELETGHQIFPRHIVFHKLYIITEIMHRNNWFRLDFNEPQSLDLPISDLMTIQPKKILSQAFDFMDILDTVHHTDINDHIDNKDMWVIQPDWTSRLDQVDTDTQRLSLKDHLRLCHTVWANFTKDYMQELLRKLSKMFIDEYLDLSYRVDFSYDAVFNLKERYLVDLFQAIRSKSKRQKALEKSKAHELSKIREAESKFPGVKIISQDSKINDLKIQISKFSIFSSEQIKILLLGERGTGKGLFAKAFHEASGRRGKFVKFDCGVKSESVFESELFGHEKGAFTGADKIRIGAFEEADQGTIFLDEIGNIPITLQKKLISVVQDFEIQRIGSSKSKKIDSWVLLATNKDLRTMKDQGEFMPDLYDRISTLPYEIPPLRKRKGDIPLLIEHFIEKFDFIYRKDPTTQKLTITKDCQEELSNWDWSGNVRELEGVIDGIVKLKVLNEDRSPIDIPNLSTFQTKDSKSAQTAPKRPKSLPGSTKVTDDQIRYYMEKLEGNKTHAAKALKVSYKTINRRWKSMNE
jgi:DNA-binding NtrC family response regulator